MKLELKHYHNIIACNQFFGVLFGLLLVESNSKDIVDLSLLILLLTLSLFAGVLLIVKPVIGTQLSIINYVLQVIDFRINDSFDFGYNSGFYLNFKIIPERFNLGFDFGFETVFYFLDSVSDFSFVSINLTAISFIYILTKDKNTFISSEFGMNYDINDV